MTNAYAPIDARSLAYIADQSGDGIVERLRAAWTKYVTYRRTLAELRDLSSRALQDLDLSRADLPAIARRDVYGR